MVSSRWTSVLVADEPEPGDGLLVGLVHDFFERPQRDVGEADGAAGADAAGHPRAADVAGRGESGAFLDDGVPVRLGRDPQVVLVGAGHGGPSWSVNGCTPTLPRVGVQSKGVQSGTATSRPPPRRSPGRAARAARPPRRRAPRSSGTRTGWPARRAKPRATARAWRPRAARC